jgi:hypothetical protein
MLKCDSNSQSSKWSLNLYSNGACNGTSVSAPGSGLTCTTVNSNGIKGSIAVDCSAVVSDHATSGTSPASTVSSSIALATAVTAAVGAAAVMMV